MARGRRQPSIEQARRHLWAVTFVIIAALSVAVVYFTGHGGLDSLPLLLSERLRIALGVLVVAFLTYVVDRERHLRRLADRLTDQRVESVRLAAKLESLEELQQERDTNAALLDGAADGIAVVDRNLRLVRFNPTMAALTGVAADRAAGGYAPLILRFSASDGTPLQDGAYPLRSVLADGRPVAGIELLLHGANDETQWVSGTFSPITDAAGRTDLVLAVLRDITQAKEMESMQRDFVSIVSHELRAPLTAIKGFAKTLLLRGETLQPDTRAEFLSTVNSQADRLARLVDDLLQVSRIDARRLRVDRAPLVLADLVADLIRQFESRWTRPVILDVPAGLTVRGDRGKLEEVLINLVDNAIKYSPAGTPVRIAARQAADEVEIEVEDHGAGITADDAAKLFQKFQRLSTPATRDVGGSGLGLYIVKGLVDAMGGRVWVESAPGAGATFAFTMPAAKFADESLERVGA